MTTTAALLADLGAPGADSLAAVSRELIGPLAGAATPSPLPWGSASASAEVTVPDGTRYPLVLVTLLADLDTDQLVVTPSVATAAGPTQAQSPITFAPWSQAGSSVPADVPAVDAAGAATGLRLVLTGARTAADGTVSDLSGDALRTTVRVDLVQGLLGRVLVAMTAEKARMRRCARELAAMRTLATARGNALDRLGDDLRCPRFADELVWDRDRRSPATRPLQPPGTTEDDAPYRARLRTLRGFRLPTPVWADSALNGGLVSGVEVDETPNVLNLAFRLVAPGSADGRAKLLDAIRRVHLVWPSGSPDGDTAHDGRLVTQLVYERVAALRAALGTWHLPDHQPVAPSLAQALAALDGRCGQLGARPWQAVVAGQSDNGGSRLELGLGAVLAAPDPAQLDAAVTAAATLGDPALVPRPRDADSVGAWLLGACGLRTVEPTRDGTVYVSAVPMGPLVVDLSPGPDAPVPLVATASLISASDAAHDVPMADLVAAMAGRSLEAAADPQTLVAGMRPVGEVAAVAAALASVGFPGVSAVADFTRQLAAVSPRLFAAFDLGPDGTAAVTSDPTTLVRTLDAAAAAGASSVVAFLTATGSIALLIGVTGLPLAGSNLAARQTVMYRWEVHGLAGVPVQLEPRRGSVARVVLPGEGISVVTCLAHVRGNGNDPYEWSPKLAEGALLSLRQYEHLMNMIELVTPLGVRANTWELRQRHVDVDGSGAAVALTASAARTFRHYRTPR